MTEADILAGSVTNTATAEADPIEDPKDPENPKTPKGEDTTETGDEDDPNGPTPPIEDPNGHLTITKVTTSKPANGETYVLDEAITYSITVTNDGNLTITDITVTDELTGNTGDKAWTIASLAPEASQTFTASYTVTSDDILAGEVLNVATAKGTSPDPDEPDVPVEPGKDPEPTEDLDTTLTVNKVLVNTPADGKAFKLGETIKYEITVTNEGNVPYYNVVISDDLTGATKTVAELGVGKSDSLTTEYVVTEADILAGSVKNTATAKGDEIEDPKDPENPKTPEGEDTTTTGDEDDPNGPTPPIEDPNGHLTVTKVTTSTPANGKAYVEGETISYRITATNDGNLTLTNITVTDELTGGEWKVASLAPAASQNFTTSYVVTAADAEKGEVVNVATAKGTSPDPDNPDVPVTPGEDPEPVQSYYTLTIHYRTDGVAGDWSTYTAQYQANAAYNVLSPAREGYAPNVSRVTGTITEDTEVVVTYYPYKYGITIHYRYINGIEAAPDYFAHGTYGLDYKVDSPVLAGWTADQTTVSGKMPAHDVEITVFYTPDYTPGSGGALPEGTPVVVKTLTIDEYGTALGLGEVSLNVGETIE